MHKKITTLLALLFFSHSALAINSLGEKMVSPIPSAKVSLEKAQKNPDEERKKDNNKPISSQYTVLTSEIKGTTVKQFVNNHNSIFAVSWNGANKPDLQQLLGKHYKHLEQNKHIFTSQEIAQQDFVINSVEKRGSYRGSASIPSITPNGFSFE